jgi:ABC-type proline/glycine betaine transport system permease subunit
VTTPTPTPQDSHAALVLALFLACLCVVYWRTALRVLAIILVALTICGIVAGYSGMRHF